MLRLHLVNPDNVPTLVRLDAVTPLASVVPDNVPAAAVIVTSADPSKATPLIFLDVASLVAVPAFPSIAVPDKVIAPLALFRGIADVPMNKVLVPNTEDGTVPVKLFAVRLVKLEPLPLNTPLDTVIPTLLVQLLDALA